MPVEIRELIIRAVIDPKKAVVAEDESRGNPQKLEEVNQLQEQLRFLQQSINNKNER